MFARDDIFYCNCCGYFYDEVTEARVDVTLDELIEYPQFLAMVKADRKRLGRGAYLKKAKDAQKFSKGFGK